MKLVNTFALLAVLTAASSAHALDNLDMKMRCDYRINELDEMRHINLPSGEDDSASTRIRDNDIKLNVQLSIFHDSEERDQLSLRVYQITQGTSENQVTFSRDLIVNTKIAIDESGEIYENDQDEESNSIVCRPLTADEIKQREAEKTQAEAAQTEESTE